VHTTRCFALFATHFHELTALADATPLAANRHVAVHCDADSGALTMLYQVKEGPCPSSFGIQVAQSTDFPGAVIDVARAKAAQLEALGGGASSIMSSSSSSSSAAAAAPPPASSPDQVSRAKRFLGLLAAEGPAFEALQSPAKKARVRELLAAAEKA
jgi:DNA mismatch repair ATPase MutS